MTNLRKWLLPLCVLASCAAGEGRAQNLYWNPSTASANWDYSTAVWGTAPGGPYNTTWVDGANANLISTVSGGSTATLLDQINASNILFGGQFTINAGTGGPQPGSLSTVSSPLIASSSSAAGQLLSVNTPIFGAASPQFASQAGASVQIALNASNTFSGGMQVGGNTKVSIGNAATGQTGTLAGNVSLGAATSVISFESAQTYSGVVSGTGQLNVSSPSAGSTTLTLTRANTLTGPVTVTDRSTLALANNGGTTAGSITGASRITLAPSATLDVTGHTAGTWALGTAQTLESQGTTASASGRVLGPAAVQGTLVLGNATAPTAILRQQGGNLSLLGGSTYRATINTTTNWSGVTPGVDFSQILGVGGAKLDLTGASAANPIRLDVRGAGTNNFNTSVAGTWTVADFSAGNASGGVVGFSADKFTIDTSNFGHNLDGGAFVLSTDAAGNQLVLSFAPVPEPGWALGLGALGLALGGAARRKFRRAARQPV